MKGTEDTLEWEHYQKTDHKLSETKLRLNLVVNYHKSEKGILAIRLFKQYLIEIS